MLFCVVCWAGFVACYGHRSNGLPASLLLHAVARCRRVCMCSRRLLATGCRSNGLPASLPSLAVALLPLCMCCVFVDVFNQCCRDPSFAYGGVLGVRLKSDAGMPGVGIGSCLASMAEITVSCRGSPDEEAGSPPPLLR